MTMKLLFWRGYCSMKHMQVAAFARAPRTFGDTLLFLQGRTGSGTRVLTNFSTSISVALRATCRYAVLHYGGMPCFS